ncbi:chemosensory pili system protein ChpA (sensor histidine kinase/response regulator) [Thiocapsa roseopersicina]|uniref:Chemosensory pili system protein ChpA (Sensor histidine kinase/response regulator) n=2 Tax=Thiocapsa roseopersicina TaxID=1058 RepID=A0A1H2V356_THIRO|nr:chemosensory pili system protein ChpA (sensor histidine kinase/response regulator) [Thiocapsa roseopersicina]
MRRVRPRFHLGLVDWYRNATDPRGMTRLEVLFRKVNAGLGGGVLADLFGLAEIFAAALRDGRLGCDAGTRSLMGQLDRVLKPLAQQPPLWPEVEARALIDRLLDVLGGLEPGDRRVVDLAAVYRSSEAIGSAQRPHGDRPAPSREDDVDRTGGRLAEFVAFEDLLERIDRGAFVDPAALDAAYAALHEGVGVLDPTDACGLAPRLAAIADQVKALVSAGSVEQSTRLEALAADLLALESILQAWVDEGVVAEAPYLGPGMDPAELAIAALRELDRELLGVTELLFGTRRDEDVSMRSDAVGAMLARIAGVLRLLGRADDADLATACVDWVRRNTVPDARSFDVGREPLVDALACLGREIRAGLAAGRAAPAPTGCAEQALITLARAIEQTSAQSMPPAPPNGTPSDVPSFPPTPTLAEEAIAPELMEIFLEEIDEELASARVRLARWSLDPRDASAVTGLKRNFSVIKGSGLLVGARRVAEVAEAVEGLLVRVTAQPTRDPAATSFIAEVLDRLPELVHGGTEDRSGVVAVLVARAERIAEAAKDTDLEVDGLSALVPLDGLAVTDDAMQIPIEDLLDTFEAAPETPGDWVLPDADESPETGAADAPAASDEALGRSEQTLGEELGRAFSALLDPATAPAADPAFAATAPFTAEADPIPAAASLVEQIAEIARCREALDITHAQLVSGLDALDLGLARLRDLVDRLASAPHPRGGPPGEGGDDMGKAVGQRDFCGRVGEILDDLESVRRGLIADRQASDETRARQAKLLEAVLDALLKRNLELAD